MSRRWWEKDVYSSDLYHRQFSLPIFSSRFCLWSLQKSIFSIHSYFWNSYSGIFVCGLFPIISAGISKIFFGRKKKGGIHTNSWPSLLGLTSISYPPAGPIEAQTWTSEVIATRHDETKFGPDRQINGPRLKPRTKLLGHSWQWRRKYFFWGNAASRGVPYFMSLNVLHFLSLKEMLNSTSFSLKKALLRWNTTKLCLHI